ncbi:MAG: FAD-dependent oxidoreductase, partial [Desulfovibrionaceae bacterium]|nr:FAD-dependent oxidoreductase [Desulfovibrionaceae bacterium]
LGSCVAACQFDAIRMGPDNYPLVDPNRCVACGGCAQACPRGVISILSMSARLTHLNETSDCLAPCRQKCPGQIDIPRYIQQLRRGDVAGAVLTIKERNPLLLVCGRVCPRPCETACRRNHVDSPVAINMLKRYAADWEMNSGARLHIPCAPDTKRRVAVVGGGPAGLSCAYFLRRLGHSPTIFESMPLLGGQLRYGIPEYRLPKAVLDWEIEGILELGVETRTGLRFGRDIGLESLRAEGFEAVFLGIGAWLSSAMRVEGEDSEGVMAGTEFLTRVGLGADTGLGKKVVVVGGGNTAIDAARTSVRLGAEATIMYRRSRQEMPANDEEVLGAEQEGVKFMFLAAPTRVLTGPSGRAEALEYVQMKLGEPDASGRRRPEPVPGSETTIQADTIIAAIGQKPELACLYLPDQTCPLEETKWRTLAADPDTLQTSLPDVFTAGDMFTGPNLVIGAVGGGRRAARSIHQFLTQGAVTRPDKLQRDMIPYTLFSNVQDVRPRQRAETPHLCHGRERTCTFAEIEGPLNADQALAESCRCLHCGLTCYDRDPEPGAA